MVRLTQVDLAYKDPKAGAKWHSDLLGLPFEEVFEGIYCIKLDGSELHFVETAAAGAEEGEQGIHQFHFSLPLDIDGIVSKCEELGLEAQLGEFGPGGKVVFLWDNEKNPVVLKPDQSN